MNTLTDSVSPDIQSDLSARSTRAVWHPCTQMKCLDKSPPIAIESGSGPWLTDTSGRRYFDACSSWWVNLFGHANPFINEALRKQLDTLEHTLLAGCTHAPAVELAERLSDLTGNHLGHAFYASDGASAVEIALKMSFHYWRNAGKAEKRSFVCLRQSYHGESIGALSVTDVEIFRDAYAPLLMRTHRVMSPDTRLARVGERADDVVSRALQDVEELFEHQSEGIAAIIVEPMIQCATGMAMYPASYLTELRRLCDRYSVHLIADEIAVGFGRTGKFFAFEHAISEVAAENWPDFMCLSKGLTGGYLPLSVVLVRGGIYDGFLDDDVGRGFLHSHSYTGNPLACRAALATLDLFERDNVLAENSVRAQWLGSALEPVARASWARHTRQLGMVWACDVADCVAGERFAERLMIAARAHEVLLRPIGNTVYLMPPYIFDEPMAAWLGERVGAAIDEALAGGIGHAT